MDRGDCLWCGEPVLETEPFSYTTYVSEAGASRRWQHWECAARAVVGSVAHQQGLCHCFGGKGEDDPALTKRQAARAAYEFMRRRERETM